MASVVLKDVDKGFGALEVLRGVSLAVEPRDRLGLVGPNGTGKTTLLRLMAGLEEPDAGSVEWAGGVSIGLLDQTQPLESGVSLEEAMVGQFAELVALEGSLRELEACMADPSRPEARGRDLEALGRAYAQLTERFEAAGGYEYRTRVAAALTGLGFRQPDFGRPVSGLSGGEKVRAALARLLISRPTLLLLDEPTNHLDLLATEWLEEYLTAYQGAVVVVSHDRYLLDRLCERVAELEGRRLFIYPGNYSDYVRLKEEELLRDAVRRRELEAQAGTLRAFIAKYKAGSKKKAAEARGKRSMLHRVEERAATLRARQSGGQARAFRFRLAPASGKEVINASGLTKSFGERRLFGPLDLRLRSGQRLALVGPNGCGKTTLLRILLGEEPADEGEVVWGQGTDVGYLRQDLGGLDEEQTVLEAMLGAAELIPGEARSWLGAFQFSGDDALKRVGDLSGGERCRLSMALLLAAGSNVLVLDEPTNHLDLWARAALERLLVAYGGTVLFVSHDRYFIDRVAGSVLVFEADGVVTYEGNFSAYREAAARGLIPRPGSVSGGGSRLKPGPAPGSGFSQSREAREAQRVADLLAEKAALEGEMRTAPRGTSPRQQRKRLDRYREIEAELERLEAWAAGRDRSRGPRGRSAHPRGQI